LNDEFSVAVNKHNLPNNKKSQIKDKLCPAKDSQSLLVIGSRRRVFQKSPPVFKQTLFIRTKVRPIIQKRSPVPLAAPHPLSFYRDRRLRESLYAEPAQAVEVPEELISAVDQVDNHVSQL
jgi:hypothetical protein